MGSNLPNEFSAPTFISSQQRNPDALPTVDELNVAIGNYEFIRPLGRGGMGGVFLARHATLQRDVAIKVLKAGFAEDSDIRQRFLREARTLGKLRHPRLVTVFDFGEAGGWMYFVMEYVQGGDLRQLMRKGILPVDKAIDLFLQVLEAFEFAHSQGVIHRDVKPENILLDSRGQVRIADFGLAKNLNDQAGQVKLTANHQVMGTLRYISPEQLAESRSVDHRADIYSLGVVFYEMIRGHVPLGRCTWPPELLQAAPRVDQVVQTAIAQDPQQRFLSVAEFREQLVALGRRLTPRAK